MYKNMLKIIADTRWFGMHGIGRFATEIISRLPEATALPHGLPLLHPLDPFWLSYKIKQISHDVYFSPGFNPPAFSDAPLFFTIHDLIHLKVSSETGVSKKLYYKHIVLPAVKRAKKVFTVSQYSKNEILAWSGVSADRIVVVGNGVDHRYTPIGTKHTPGFPYLFYVGNRKPHKNINRLLQAFAASGISSDVKLLLSGQQEDEVMKYVASLGIENHVEFAGVIPEQLLPDYYRGATALVFPSLYEGFGLPALEAMASGVPVVVSDMTSLPEVVGNAGVLVDPLNIESIAHGIKSAVFDEALRTDLIGKGVAQARLFTWEKCAETVKNAIYGINS